MSKKKEMTAQESLAAAQEYYRLMRAGVPPADAFKQAYPNGVPTREDQLKEAAKAEQKAGIAAVGGQVAGTAAGVYGASKLASALGFGSQAAGAAGATTGAAGTAAAGTAATGAGAGAAGASSAGAAGGSGIAGAATPATGSMMASAAPYLGAAGAGLGAYGVYDATQMRDRPGAAKAGAMSGAGMGLGLAAAAPLLGLGPLGWGAYGLMALGGAGLGGGLGAALAHEGTADAQNRRWGGLAERGVQSAADFAHKNPGETGTWEDGKYAGQQWTFEKALDLAKENPDHFRGVYGNFDVFGNDWTQKYGDDEQRKIVSALINEGLYKSNKGDVIITDQDKAREVAARALSEEAPPQTNAALGAPMKQLPGQVAPQQLQGLAAALTPMMQQQQPDAGTLRRWRLGRNG